MQLRSALVFAILTALALCTTAEHAATWRPRVASAVHRKLQRQGVANIIVSMRDGITPVLESLAHESTFATRGDKIADMVGKLESHAQRSQQEITALLAQESAVGGRRASEVRSFWITNQLYFRDATFQLVEKLASMPSVAVIEEEPHLHLPAMSVVVNASSTTIPTTTTTSASATSDTPQWGVEKIQAPSVWAMGNTGKGVVVGSIDTGVRASHEILRDSFRREFGWFDPENNSVEPYDGQSRSHGTYCMGSLVGSKGYGVAPGAQWISCKAWSTNASSLTWPHLLACAQFMTCPTDTTGTTKDCSKAPHLVNCEFAGGQNDTYFTHRYLDAWARAGILAIVPLGNHGPSCQSANSPGDGDFVNMISVGATDSSDALAQFSDRGPSVAGRIKPEISAPGRLVKSAARDSDTAYVTQSGTSPASPHVAGVVALLLSANPSLTFDQIRRALLETTDQASLRPTGQTCGGTVDGVFPNNMYGHGRVNALSAVTGSRAPPSPSPSPPPTPPPGRCTDLSVLVECEARFFCTWSALKKSCQRWWK